MMPGVSPSSKVCLVKSAVQPGQWPLAEEGDRPAAATGSLLPALRNVVASLPDCVLLLDRDLRVVTGNRWPGRASPQEIEGAELATLLPQPVRDDVLQAAGRVLAGGPQEKLIAALYGTEGQERHFELTVSAIPGSGQPAVLTLHGAETTERTRAERAMAVQARMIESMLEGVAVISEGGVIEITNPAFDAMFGFERGRLVGSSIASLAGRPFDRPERWRMPEPGMRSVNIEFEGRRHDGGAFAAAGVLAKLDIAGHEQGLVVLQDVSERQELERAILQAVNREQYRIGNDLHDGLGQELTGIALMLRGVAGRVATEYPPILTEIEGITHLVNNAIESTRALARGLSPVNLERGGLRDALEGLAMHASELYGVNVAFTHRVRTPRPLGAELANHLYRIAQEALRNAVQHGRARTIRLHLSSLRGNVRLAITDDGIGMQPQALDAAGMGLKIMRYRARILGGQVRFEPGDDGGTRVICECPLALTAPRRAASVMDR